MEMLSSGLCIRQNITMTDVLVNKFLLNNKNSSVSVCH